MSKSTGSLSDDLRKASEQAAAAVGGVLEQARTPLLAALGAGDLAAKAVVDALTKAREAVSERAETAKSTVGDLPSDLGELRTKLDPNEVRKLVDAYTKAALQLYQYLAERGESALDRVRNTPQVQQALHQVESSVDDVRELADDVLGKVTRRTRSTGEKVAKAAEDVAEKAAETVQEAGAKAADAVVDAGAKTASTARSTARKTASRTAPANKPSSPRSTGKTTR